MTIGEITNKYKDKIDYLDLEIIIANSLKKTREFVLTYPEYSTTKIQDTKIKECIRRRIKGEPIAYIFCQKEFYGLNFIVSSDTLVPRPETEMMVEEAIQLIQDTRYNIQDTKIIDIGTGSGCIIIAVAHTMEHGAWSMEQKNNVTFFGSDISDGALKMAKKNARVHGLDKKIKFLQGNLLEPIIGNWKLEIGNSRMIILANLPYLSNEIYNSAPIDVKKFEPKSALFSPQQGLQHYRKLLEQLQTLLITSRELQITLLMEISPEQKVSLTKLIKSIFPKVKAEFKKDLANKWRLCKISI